LALAVLLVAAAVLPANLATAFHGKQVYVVGDCLHPKIRPTSIIFTCADMGSYARELRYLTYGGKVAVAHATWHHNECNPDCARGRFVSVRTTITLFAVAHCEGRFFYTKAHISALPRITWHTHCGRVLPIR
jgi:hypothetical protein